MAVLVCCEVLPSTMLILPAAQGGLTVSLQYYASQLQEWGIPLPSLGPVAAALAITALLAACARALEHAISEEEYVSAQLLLICKGASDPFKLSTA